MLLRISHISRAVPSKFLQYVEQDIDIYGKIERKTEAPFKWYSESDYRLSSINIDQIKSPQAFLIFFLSEFLEFDITLKKVIQTAIEHEVEKNINLFSRSIFFSESLEDHLSKVMEYRSRVFDDWILRF